MHVENWFVTWLGMKVNPKSHNRYIKLSYYARIHGISEKEALQQLSEVPGVIFSKSKKTFGNSIV